MVYDPAQMASNVPIWAFFFEIVKHDLLFPNKHKITILCVNLDTPMTLNFGAFFFK